MKLKYTAKKVAKIEETLDMPIEKALQDTKMSNLVQLVRFGQEEDISVDKAYDLIDEYLKEHDKTDIVFDVMEALVDAGFLSRKMNIQALRKEQNQEIEKAIKEITK